MLEIQKEQGKARGLTVEMEETILYQRISPGSVAFYPWCITNIFVKYIKHDVCHRDHFGAYSPLVLRTFHVVQPSPPAVSGSLFTWQN